MAVTAEQAQAVHSAYVSRKYEYAKRSDKYMVQYQLGRITKEEWGGGGIKIVLGVGRGGFLPLHGFGSSVRIWA